MDEWPRTLSKSTAHPPVSILTPTHNRVKFLPALFACILAQTYPRDRMEWVVYDDGTESAESYIDTLRSRFTIQYIRSDVKLTIGAKRNALHKAARGAILVCMDDDDYYMPERVAHAVQTLLSKRINGRPVEICGSTQNICYFNDNHTLWEVGPYRPYHATFGTMAFTRAYALTHACNTEKANAEEVEFTNTYTEPLAQLDPLKVMVVMCHSCNTFNKHALRERPSPVFRRTSHKLKDYVRSAELREFYMRA